MNILDMSFLYQISERNTAIVGSSGSGSSPGKGIFSSAVLWLKSKEHYCVQGMRILIVQFPLEFSEVTHRTFVKL